MEAHWLIEFSKLKQQQQQMQQQFQQQQQHQQEGINFNDMVLHDSNHKQPHKSIPASSSSPSYHHHRHHQVPSHSEFIDVPYSSSSSYMVMWTVFKTGVLGLLLYLAWRYYKYNYPPSSKGGGRDNSSSLSSLFLASKFMRKLYF